MKIGATGPGSYERSNSIPRALRPGNGIRGGIFGSDGAATAHHLVFAGSFPIRCTVGRRSFVNSVP